jgi:hypothetical protein
MISRKSLALATIAAGVGLGTPAWAEDFFFSTGNTDGLLGAASRSASAGKIETETADDFFLTQTTVINGATIVGVVTGSAANIANVEVELYHVFSLDSVDPPSGRVLSRLNSPSDVEIDSATRDANGGTLGFTPRQLNPTFTVQNTVVNGINPTPSKTGGEGAKSGEEVEVTITFTKPILLPAGHYFFRPEVLVTGDGDFLYLSAPRPIVAPGTPVSGDLQAWIRNSRLAPDWVRIGTDVIVGAPPTFNMTFSVAGNTIPGAGIPGDPTCHGDSISALARQFGGIRTAASVLGFTSVDALQDSFKEFCSA